MFSDIMANQTPAPETRENLEQTIEGLQYLHQLYQSQYVLLTQEINAMLDELSKLNSAQKTVNSIESVRNKNAMMPLGGGVWLAIISLNIICVSRRSLRTQLC